jgi:hypothetical protein
VLFYQDIAIRNNKISSSSSVFKGNPVFSTQISIIDSSSEKDMNSLSLTNGLSIIDVSKCADKLKATLGLRSIIIVKNDIASEISDNESYGAGVIVNMYNGETKARIDLSTCSGDHVVIKSSLASSRSIYNDKFIYYFERGFNIYDPNSPFVNSRCYPVLDKDTAYDTTLNYRRLNIFGNKKINCIGATCIYSGIDDNGYIICECSSITPNRINVIIEDISLSSLNTIWLDIITCADTIFSVISI